MNTCAPVIEEATLKTRRRALNDENQDGCYAWFLKVVLWITWPINRISLQKSWCFVYSQPAIPFPDYAQGVVFTQSLIAICNYPLEFNELPYFDGGA